MIVPGLVLLFGAFVSVFNSHVNREKWWLVVAACQAACAVVILVWGKP